jgi:hypothetical protein
VTRSAAQELGLKEQTAILLQISKSLKRHRSAGSSLNASSSRLAASLAMTVSPSRGESSRNEVGP